MSDTEDETGRTSVTKVPRFYGRRGEDYGLWRLRLRAACRVKGVWNLVGNAPSSATSSDATVATTGPDKERMKAKLEKASGMIISSLGNTPLRVVADADDDPARMLQLLDARYASNRTVSRIAVQTQLYRKRYRGQDMSKYIDEYTALFSQLEFMGNKVAVPEVHKAPMLLASIDPKSAMEPIAAALRTKDADDLTWEYVATTLIDEYNSRFKTGIKSSKYGNGKGKGKWKRRTVEVDSDGGGGSSDESTNIQIATRALVTALDNLKAENKNDQFGKCEFCNRRGHTEPTCFLNPDNPNNRLPPRMRERMMMTCDTKSKKKQTHAGRSGNDSAKLEIVGMVQSNTRKTEHTTVTPPKDDRTYHDSGATSHVYHSEDAFVTGSIAECEPCTVLLADKSSITASQRGEVILPFDNANIRLKHVLHIPGLGYNLVSVGRLADNGISSLLTPKC